VFAPASNRRGAGVALVIGSACCFGTLGVFGKLAYRLGLTTPQLLSYRFALAALLLWLAAAVTRQGLPPRRSLIGLAIMGGAGYVGQSASYFSALHYIPVSTTALLLYTFPVVVTLLARLLFGEPLGWTKIGAVVLAFIGTMLVVEAQLKAAPPIGIVLGLTSAAVYSGYILFGSRLLPGIPPVSATATIVGTTIPVLAFILGLRLVGASRAAILSTFEPASSVLLAVLILGESANPIQYLGGAFILASVVVLEGQGWRASRGLAQATRE
jgi:drug/metabolite transporter (DMT)-like permease